MRVGVAFGCLLERRRRLAVAILAVGEILDVAQRGAALQRIAGHVRPEGVQCNRRWHDG